MRSRVNGGLIGPYQVPGQTVTSTVRSIDEASRLVSGGQWPGSTYAATNIAPVITTVVSTDAFYANIDDTAIVSTGGYVRIFGSGFTSGATVYLNGNAVVSNTFVNSGEIRALLPGYIAGTTATLMVFNGAAGAIYLTGVAYSNAPSWVTATGSLATVYETTAINNTVQATGDGLITYAIDSGNLPSGVNLNPLTGVLSGTAPADSGSTTYNFTIRATDAQNQDSYRLFSLTINTDNITWVTPAADGITYNLSQNIAMSDVTVNAVAGTSSVVTYSANALPTGLSLLYGVISGTPTVVGSNVSLITATSTITNRTATRLINWTISIASDLYWKFSTLLLTANAVATGNSVVTDSSITNAQITVFGDARAHNFNPYSEGYYSVFFPANGSYLTGSNALFNLTNQLWAWTFECWIYPITAGAFFGIGSGSAFGNSFSIDWGLGTANKFRFIQSNGSSTPVTITSAGTYPAGQWYNITVTNDTAGVRRLFVNGIQDGTQTYTAAALAAGTTFVVNGLYDNNGLGNNGGSSYISNLRFSSNVTLYTSNFIPTTSSLTSASNTSLLVAKSQRILDASPNNFTITTAGTPRVASSNPFANVAPTSVTIPDAANYSVYFDGTGDYLSPTLTGQNPGTGNFTYECWFYISSLAAIRAIFNTRSGDTTDGFDCVISTTGVITISYTSTGLFTSAAGAVVIGRWYHIAIVRTDTSTVTVYLNGVSQGNWTAGASSNFTSTTMYIGAAALVGVPMLGYISNFRYTKSAVYTAAFTPSTTSLTAIANTQLLTCQNSTLIDNSTNAFTITANGDARPARNGPFIATTALALTGTEGSAYFDGTGDYLQVSGGVAPVIGQSSATVEFWVYPLAIDSYRRLITTSVGAFTTGDFVIRFNNGTFLAGDSINSINVGTLPTINQWNHVAWVGTSGTAQTLYINGAKVGTAASYNITATMQYIGGYYTTGPAEFSFGYMSGVRVVKGTALYTSAFFPGFAPLTAVTNTQLLTLQNRGSHNNSAFIDEGSIGNVVVRTGNATNGAFTPYGNNWSVYFDGASYISTPAGLATAMGGGFATNIISIEMFVYPTNLNNGSYINGFIGAYQAVAANGRWNFWHTRTASSTTTLGFSYTTGTGSQADLITTATPLTQSQWNHIAVTIDATTSTNATVTIFANGALVQAWTAQNMSTQTTYYSSPNIGGPNSSFVSQFAGYMSNLRILKGAFAYTGAYTVPVNVLQNTSATVLNACQSNRFIDASANNYTLTPSGATVTVQKFSPFATVIVPAYYSGSFNGSTDYLTVPASQAFAFGTGDFTVEAWVYTTARNATYGSQIAGPHLYGVSADWLLTINPSGNLYFQISGTATGAQTSTSTVALSTWTHVVVTRASGTVAFYINGVSAGTGSYATAVTNASTALGIGGSSNGNAAAAFAGYISNLRIVKGVALYTGNFTVPTAPLALTQSAGTNIVALTGIPANGNSVYFNGSSSISLPNTSQAVLNVAAGATFTIEAWVYLLSISSLSTILADNVPGAASVYWAFDVNTSGNPRFYWYTGSTNFATSTSALAVNTWYHVAMTANAGAIAIYVNGTLQTLTGTTTLTNPSGNTGSIAIGQQGSPVSYTTGYISNVRVTKNQALYTTSFTPTTSPLTTTSQSATATNVSLLTCQPTQTTVIVDNGLSNLPITVNGTARASRTWSPFGYTPALLALQNNTFTDSALDYLTITAATNTVKPLAVSPFTPVVSSEPLPYSPARFGGSIYFDGTGDVLTSPGSTAFTFGADNFTVEYWVYHTTVANTYNQHVGAATTTGGFGFGVNNATLKLYMTTSTTGYTSTGSSLILNQWHHVAFCRVSGTVTYFLDGVVNYTVSIATSITETNYGIGNPPSGTAYPMTGYLAGIRVTKGVALYTSSFSPATSPATPTYTIGTNTYSAALLLNGAAGAANDATRTIDLETVADAKTVQNSPYSGSYYSNYFDGTGDYLSVAYNSAIDVGTGDFTLECWVFKTTTSTDWRIAGGPTGAGFFGEFSSQIGFGISTVEWTAYYAGKPIPLNTWAHVAWSRSSNTMYVFINGVLAGSTSVTGKNYGLNNGSFLIGSENGSNLITGYISSLRLVKGTGLYTTAFTPSTTPLTAVSGTGLLTCQNNRFVDNSTNAFTITKLGDTAVRTQNPFRINAGVSYYFDGTGDYLKSAASTPALALGSGDFTIEFWVQPSSLAAQFTLVDFRGAAGTVGFTDYVTTNGKINLFQEGGTTYLTTTGSLVAGVWTHVAYVRSSGTIRVYFNGVADATTASNTTNWLAPNGVGVIGVNYTLANYFTGHLTDFRITRGYARYTATFTPPTEPFIVK